VQKNFEDVICAARFETIGRLLLWRKPLPHLEKATQSSAYRQYQSGVSAIDWSITALR